MSGIHEPNRLDEICELVRTHEQIVVSGGASKVNRPGRSTNNLTVVSTKRYQGIVDHQTSDFTITARSGTLVSELQTALKQTNQFLPFDPTFANQGSTIGGLVASGLNGPCRLRFGGIRDFAIGCQLIDGQGQAIRAGGRVVKNAAGFDLPKFMIGSAGRFGILSEVTFKVFPIPPCYATIIYDTLDFESAVRLTQQLNNLLEFDALEISPTDQVIGRVSSYSSLACLQQIESLPHQTTQGTTILQGPEEMAFWRELANFTWLGEGESLIKIPLALEQLRHFEFSIGQLLPKATRRFSAAGNLALLAIKQNRTDSAKLSTFLVRQKLTGQVITGDFDQYLIGTSAALPFLKRIKLALDPTNRFGGIGEIQVKQKQTAPATSSINP